MYNVADYIERCIRSIEAQDISRDEYEIICIDDGSPDNCAEIVKKLQSEFDNILLIEQENQGVSCARNNGMDKASGSYLLMVDPDDYLIENSLKEKLEIIEHFDLDIAYTGYIILDKSLKESYIYDLKLNNEILSGCEYYCKYDRGRSEVRDSDRSWAIFLSAQFIRMNELRYLADVPYLEDGEFICRVNCLANRVTFLSKPFYLRTIRVGSATNSNLFYSTKAQHGFLKAAHNLVDFKEELLNIPKHEVCLNHKIIHFVLLYVASFTFLGYIRNVKLLYSNLKKGRLRKLSTYGASDFYRRAANYYNYSIHLLFVYWMYFRLKKSIFIRLNRFRDFF